MADNTPILKLPYIVLSQSQKEVTHNEALNRMDALIQTAVEDMTLTTPPTGIEGALYVVGTGATGSWASKDNYLAQYIGGVWVFYAPFEGLRAWNKATATAVVYKSSAWSQEDTAQAKIGFFGSTPAAKMAVTLANADGAIGGLTISATYSQAEGQALRNKCEELADDVRALKSALSNYGLV